jgi:hypothetical protein
MMCLNFNLAVLRWCFVPVLETYDCCMFPHWCLGGYMLFYLQLLSWGIIQHICKIIHGCLLLSFVSASDALHTWSLSLFGIECLAVLPLYTLLIRYMWRQIDDLYLVAWNWYLSWYVCFAILILWSCVSHRDELLSTYCTCSWYLI